VIFRAEVAVARLAAVASRRTGSGGGTTLPGKLLLRLAPDAIGRLASSLAGSTVISATNGKTTTAKMAASVLEAHGASLCRNSGGANLDSGIASALLTAEPGQIGLFEVDEAALTGVCASLSPSTLTLGNLFRDQLDRYGELELIGERWRGLVAGLGAACAVAYNTDDPLVAGVGASAQSGFGFGIEDMSVGRERMQHAADSKWCARCGHRLGYDAVFLGHLGHWSCPNCGNARPAPSVVARDVRQIGLEASEFTLELPDDAAKVHLPVGGLYNVYNALAAAAVGHAHGAPAATVAEGLARFSAAFGRGERIDLSGRETVVLLIKNPAGANEVIRTLAAEPVRKTLLVALNDRIADGRDVSWIWDIDFEELVPQVDHVFVTGTRAAEMGMRLKYAGVPAEAIRVEPQLDGALDAAARTGGGPLYLLPTSTAMLDQRRLLVDRGAVRPYWEAA
jgi:UDP-N-acetylmuramyl tripeptide synthase